MPELPEVETIVRELAPRLEGHKIARARLAKSDVLRRVSKPRLLRTLKGNTVEEVSRRAKHARSEEHTSELQSPCNLVCRLLLEKKKKKKLKTSTDDHAH